MTHSVACSLGPTRRAAVPPLLPHRVRAPRADGGTLIEPPLEQVAALLAANAARRAAWDYDVQGRSLRGLAAEARQALLDEAYRYTSAYRSAARPASTERILLAGHQPQLFHAGVWFKNFVLGGLAQAHAATAVNLVIDSDTSKTASLRVPAGTIDSPHVEIIPFDGQAAALPFEDRRVEDSSVLAAFGQRACQAIRPLVPDPLLESYWPTVVARAAATGNLGAALAQSRHQLEAQWGLQTLELPQSRVCGLTPFFWFACHLLAHLPRFWDLYNAAVHDYRRAYRIRSRTHPVPDLAADGPWLEAPFWVWTADAPRRRRLFARQRGDDLLVTDRSGWELALPLEPEADAQGAVQRLAELPRQGVRLRTRALLTTMFARMFLGDLFLHGIGGGKYDELTDVLVERFFGLAPPRFLVVTATLHLPIQRPAVAADELRRIDQQLRDLAYHPERFLEAGQAAELVARKRQWIASEPTPATARLRCRAIRQTNEELQAWVAPRREELVQRRQRLASRRRAEGVLASREYAFCLHPARTLRDFLLAFRAARP